MIMTPTHTDSPLRIRRSQVGAFRTPVQVAIENDDEAERREARRRTVFEDNTATTESTIEDNEALKDCLKIYNENKLSKENAWSVSLIDTVSRLLDKHHKSLSNFKVVGSTLEASSKVYGLRVDSIHTDVVRLSSGLSKQKFVERNDDENDEVDQANVSENGHKETNDDGVQDRPKKKKRNRKLVSTITKNKDTINGRLDTNPFTDPIFAKLNSVVGSVNSSNRILQNFLPSIDSELRLRMDYVFWDSETKEPATYLEETDDIEYNFVDGTIISQLNLNTEVLRPNHVGYIITDTPVELDDDDRPPTPPNFTNSLNNSEMAVAFDMNAVVEPITADAQTFVDVDMGDLDELTIEERLAINNCRGLRRAPVLIEDMRPVDSTSSTLEYSYRALDKISQFWAGPSHWKFKKSRNKSLSIAQRFSRHNNNDQNSQHQNHRRRRPLKNRIQELEFYESLDDLFQNVKDNTKIRKVNIQRKWDAKKLKLPTDLQVDRNSFDVYRYAFGMQVQEVVEETISPQTQIQSGYDYNNPVDQEYCANVQNDDYPDSADAGADGSHDMNDDVPNQTIVEIPSDFAGAPDKVTKIVVPFAKRAKVIDMKQLKKCCTNLIQNQFTNTNKENVAEILEDNNEKYKPGFAKFQTICDDLPKLLTPNMVEAVTPSVAFYSILHLANEHQLRLLPQSDLKDFKILQIDE